MLPLIKKVAVDDKGWLTDEEIVDCFAVSQSLPGVLAINAAIFIGGKKRGFVGALASALGVILPAFFAILIILVFLGKIEDNIYVKGAFEGIKAASVALILVTAYNMGRRTLKARLDYLIAAVSFILIVLVGISAVWAIVIGGLSGYIAYRLRLKKGREE